MIIFISIHFWLISSTHSWLAMLFDDTCWFAGLIEVLPSSICRLIAVSIKLYTIIRAAINSMRAVDQHASAFSYKPIKIE